MVCWHNRYCLGDKKNMCREYEDPREWFKENIDEEAGDVVLPLYLYDHSGITMRCAPFSCPWDSGQVGFIYAKADTIQKEWGDPKDPKVRERAAEYLKGEVRTYDYYLTGSVWGFVYEGPDGEDDSCWGFYGEDLENTGIEDSIPREALPLLKEAWEHRFDNNKQ
jgi:hypothetical protein